MKDVSEVDAKQKSKGVQSRPSVYKVLQAQSEFEEVRKRAVQLSVSLLLERCVRSVASGGLEEALFYVYNALDTNQNGQLDFEELAVMFVWLRSNNSQTQGDLEKYLDDQLTEPLLLLQHLARDTDNEMSFQEFKRGVMEMKPIFGSPKMGMNKRKKERKANAANDK